MILLCFVSKEKVHAPIFLNGLTKAVLRVSCSFEFYRRATTAALRLAGTILLLLLRNDN